MRLEKLAKDPGSNPDGCPTFYLTEDGRLSVQGELVDADTYAKLENVLPGEGAEPEIVIEAVRRYQERR